MNEEIKKIVQEKYGQIAKSKNQGCCGPKNFCCGLDNQYSIINNQQAICNDQYSMFNNQQTICNDQYSIINNQQTICNDQYSMFNNQQTTRNSQYSMFNVQYSMENIQCSMIGEEYKNIDGYFQEADMGLGCGLPTEFANIKQGDVVLDLGCGAGNDVFIARKYVGENGKVIGIDMTEEMLQKANINKEKLGYKNVEFRFGEIENLPVENESIDVVISNCVLNLVPDKKKAFSEIYHVLKPTGHFCISDIVVEGELPVELKKSAELYVGCVAGALQKDEYLKIILEENFKNIIIKKERRILLPESLLKKFLSEKDLSNFLKSNSGIMSITVYGEK